MISDLNIVKFNLTVEEIEAILETLVYDGKIEMRMVSDGDEKIKTYRTVETLLSSAAIVRIPCGVCPVIKIVLFFLSLLLSKRFYQVIEKCGTVGEVQPKNCAYYDQWLD
jgi:DNA-directed RNA polymerase III subunit RPC6